MPANVIISSQNRLNKGSHCFFLLNLAKLSGMMVSVINRILKPFQFQLSKIKSASLELDMSSDETFVSIFNKVRPFTMTSEARMYSLYLAVKYVVRTGLSGDFVECGVWKGGSAMLMSLTLQSLGVKDRRIYLYDTFEGMSAPTDKDADVLGNQAGELLESSSKGDNIWCYSSLEEVKANLASTGYPPELLFFIKGKVEETIPATLPGVISILRLDTDWYESTLHEMNHLYPLLATKGVLIIDDYGHWQGARKAIDEYFAAHRLNLFLGRIDYTGRLAIKN
jgi:O-methyltransferase